MQILSDHTSSQKPPFADVFQNTRFFIRNFFFEKMGLKKHQNLKDCVRYIFASSFFKSKREHLSN